MPLDAVRMLPPVILMASFTDTVVPWYESGDLHHRLLQCGARSKLLCYHKAGHADFAVDWHPLPAGSKGAQAQPTDVSDVRLQYR